MVDVLGPHPAGSLLVEDLGAVPREFDGLISDGVFHGASSLLTSAATHYPDLDFQAIGSGYATGWLLTSKDTTPSRGGGREVSQG